MDLRAFVRPAESRCEQAEHEPLDSAVETELVPPALDRVSAIGYQTMEATHEFVQFGIGAPSGESISDSYPLILVHDMREYPFIGHLNRCSTTSTNPARFNRSADSRQIVNVLPDRSPDSTTTRPHS